MIGFTFCAKFTKPCLFIVSFPLLFSPFESGVGTTLTTLSTKGTPLAGASDRRSKTSVSSCCRINPLYVTQLTAYSCTYLRIIMQEQEHCKRYAVPSGYTAANFILHNRSLHHMFLKHL
ncbi:hypothetical protein, unlikely [Trypanosoma brucei gambiense DAL972]|uniref:T. brucei spp.-specific protein n=1 Tax=Trypanosoma brucei gambiense (strain MHOM/CI/86/DAL972) TaxID=679716 RepID=C9ZPK0_TRYB9|nr:hypothetical protein, unlikely [Trypanosoma brucei gambiense DAL972]CBH11328.1 hypothetical protein, unlikely [Trypanosoma brucei gambiense DAL972]|eukprot:XP_011773615.1 hypothetical protein, unlikely [Trypanosoma brucei gambiense DAL972]